MEEDKCGGPLSEDADIKPRFSFGYGPLCCKKCQGFMVLDAGSKLYKLDAFLFGIKARDLRLRLPPAYIDDRCNYDIFVFVCWRCGNKHFHVVRKFKTKS